MYSIIQSGTLKFPAMVFSNSKIAGGMRSAVGSFGGNNGTPTTFVTLTPALSSLTQLTAGGQGRGSREASGVCRVGARKRCCPAGWQSAVIEFECFLRE